MLNLIRAVPPVAEKPSGDSVEVEANLIARAKVDREAFAPIYSRYLDPVYRYCYRRLGSQEAAEDATSQTFYKALAALPTYREGSFGGWLFTIAHNVVVDAYRHQRPSEPIEGALDLADESPTPEEVALSAEERRSLSLLLARLPDEQRNVVELRLSGLTGAEIAQALGRSLGAVKMLQFRAMARLRVLLTVEAGSEGDRGEAQDGKE